VRRDAQVQVVVAEVVAAHRVVAVSLPSASA